VHVEEPSVEDTIVILRGIAERYASFHGLRITDRPLVAAAELSARYIQARPGTPAPLTLPATGPGLACSKRLLLRRAWLRARHSDTSPGLWRLPCCT